MNFFLVKGEFSRNVLTLMTGTAIAQAIPIAISPILTRIYAPEDFGVFALYVALSSIMTIIATGRYELAIVVPKKDNEAFDIMLLSIIIAFIVSAVVLVLIFVFNNQVTRMLGNPGISNWLYLLPFSILLNAIYQSFYYWSNRKKHYKRLSVSRIVQSSSTGVANLSIGSVNAGGGGGLIFGQMLGQSVSIGVLGRLLYKDIVKKKHNISKIKMIALSKKYKKFPKFLMLAHGINSVSRQIPILLLSSFFGLGVSGFYLLVQKIIGLPMNIIASGISDVFRQEAAEQYARFGNCHSIYKSTFKKLILIATIPFVLFYFIAPILFSFVFGREWEVAGRYAQILTPMFFLQFVTSPLGNMFIVAGKQKLDLYWQIFLLFLVVTAFISGKYLFDDIEVTLGFFCMAYSIGYLVNLNMSFRFSKENSD